MVAADGGEQRESEEVALLSIISRLSKAVRSFTSNEANTDVPPGTRVPPPEHGAVPRPDREPMAGFEPQRESWD